MAKHLFVGGPLSGATFEVTTGCNMVRADQSEDHYYTGRTVTIGEIEEVIFAPEHMSDLAVMTLVVVGYIPVSARTSIGAELEHTRRVLGMKIIEDPSYEKRSVLASKSAEVCVVDESWTFIDHDGAGSTEA